MFLAPMTRNTQWARSFDRLFDESLDRWLAPTAAAQNDVARSPALDIAESDQAYTVTLDLPGVAKDDVKVSIEGRRVSIEARATKTQERKDGDRVIYRERAESSCARSFALPTDVDQDRSSAKLDNGVLKLELAKRRTATAAQIAIN
jgi:HSP20 family protein